MEAGSISECLRWVLLPGLHGTSGLFREFLRVLPNEVEPTLVDYPSAAKCHAKQLLKVVMDCIPTTGRYVLIAESFSGPLALRAAADSPNPPEAIVLCASFARSPYPRSIMTLAAWLGALRISDQVLRMLIRHFLIGDAPKEILEAVLAELLSVSPRVLRHRLLVLGQFDDAFVPSSVPVPCLYIVASQDRVLGSRVLTGLSS